jgi:hypothetical protein
MLEAAIDQHSAFILVGSQAIYLCTQSSDFIADPFTLDADIAINPMKLGRNPLLKAAVRSAGFKADIWSPGRWWLHGVAVDLLVPQSLGGESVAWAHLGAHGDRVARNTVGLEAALVDNYVTRVAALNVGEDSRGFWLTVAGPAACLVAKLHKLGERQRKEGYERAKDALDIFRLLHSVPAADFAAALGRLLHQNASTAVTAQAIEYLDQLFGKKGDRGFQLAEQCLTQLGGPYSVIPGKCLQSARDLLSAAVKLM